MKKKINLILLADHSIGYEISEYLINAENANILGLYTNKPGKNRWWPNIKKLENKYKFLNVNIFTNNNDLFKQINQLEIDLILLLSWKHIIPKEIIDIPKIGCINLHYSLLPKHRGTYPNVWPIILGENETGITFHWVDNKIDHGNVIKQGKIKIYGWETSKDLLKRLDKLACQIFIELWEDVVNLRDISLSQYLSSTYHFSKDYEQLNKLDLNKKVLLKDFINLLRAKSFYPEYKNLYYIDEETNKKVYIVAKFLLENDNKKNDSFQ